MNPCSLQGLYDAYQRIQESLEAERRMTSVRLSSLHRYLGIMPGHPRGAAIAEVTQNTGFKRIAQCRKALEALDRRRVPNPPCVARARPDSRRRVPNPPCVARARPDSRARRGWNRSFHQREFHDHFIRACARIFWKTEKPGTFARDHQRILESNGWASLSQEVLISTPRRFGKTISVSMFAAAMLFSTPNLEMSIYSTCKRISQKLLRNVYKFLGLIYLETGATRMKEIRFNFEEIVLKGPDSEQDVRVVNSYPSKVTHPTPRAPQSSSVCPLKCAAVMVSTLHSRARWLALRKRCSSMCSLASCKACTASGCQRRSDLKSFPSSLTSRVKAALGKPSPFLRR